MFVSRVVVSLRVPGLEKKSLEKITSLVYNCRMVEVYTMTKLVRVLRNFGIVVFNPNPPLFYVLLTLFPRLCPFFHSTRVAINATDLVSNTSALQGRRFFVWPRETRAQNIERFVTHFNAIVT